MSAELYNQIYRCRKCGKEFCPVTTCGREKTKEHMDNLIDRANGERLCHLFLFLKVMMWRLTLTRNPALRK